MTAGRKGELRVDGISYVKETRRRIACTAYNECLLTSLISDSMVSLCRGYERFLGSADMAEQKAYVHGMASDIALVNKRVFASGSGEPVFMTDMNDKESVIATARAVSEIFVLPYRLDLDMDYVGFALRTSMDSGIRVAGEKSPQQWFDSICHALFTGCDRSGIKSVWDHLSEAGSDAVCLMDYYNENGWIPVKTEMFSHMVEELTAADNIAHMFGHMVPCRTKDAGAIHYAIHAGEAIEYAKPGRIMEMRSDASLAQESVREAMLM